MARARWTPIGIVLSHLATTCWLFQGLLFENRVLYFRDVSLFFHPNAVFLGNALRAGVWPLWNPLVEGGAPFLFTYPVDLLLAWAGGARGVFEIGVPLHVFLAMCGGSLLGRRLGLGAWGVWAAGAFLGCSGFLLSCANLGPLLEAAAWAPWVLAALVALLDRPSGRNVAVFAALLALQVSTFGAELVIQTALCGVFLVRRLPGRRQLVALSGGVLLAALLVAPTLLGVRALLQGTARGEGFGARHALGWSLPPAVLLDAVVPQFLGDTHTFSDVGYWGQPFFAARYPYILGLYFGPIVLLLASRAGIDRLWAAALLGVLLSLGAYGPLAWLVGGLKYLRIPVKFFFLPTAAISLLAARGLDRSARQERPPWIGLAAVATGALLAAAGPLLRRYPSAPAWLLGAWVPEILDPRATLVVRLLWPAAFLTTGCLVVAAGLALRGGPRFAGLAGVVALLDLLIVNTPINPTADASFYTLRPQLRSLVSQAAAAGPYRWFAYGAANSGGLRWSARVALANRDIALYEAERQSLLSRTHVIDGLEAAFDEDRTGWTPPDAVLRGWELNPAAFADLRQRLRQANVRWVLSFVPLPEDLAAPRGQARLEEVEDPIRLYELRDPLPRAFFVGRAERAPEDPAVLQARLGDPNFDPLGVVLLGGAASVEPGGQPVAGEQVEVMFERPDPHTVRLHVSSGPGYVVFVETHHPDWHAERDGEAVPLLRANGHYWALPTPGGRHDFVVRFEPRWPAAAFGASGVGVLAALALAFRGRSRSDSLDSTSGPGYISQLSIGGS